MNQRADSWKKNLGTIVTKPPENKTGWLLSHTQPRRAPRGVKSKGQSGEFVSAAVLSLPDVVLSSDYHAGFGKPWLHGPRSLSANKTGSLLDREKSRAPCAGRVGLRPQRALPASSICATCGLRPSSSPCAADRAGNRRRNPVRAATSSSPYRR